MESYDCGLRDPAAIALYSEPITHMAPPEYKEIMSNLMDFKVIHLVSLEIEAMWVFCFV